jgi:hypothetical protein
MPKLQYISQENCTKCRYYKDERFHWEKHRIPSKGKCLKFEFPPVSEKTYCDRFIAKGIGNLIEISFWDDDEEEIIKITKVISMYLKQKASDTPKTLDEILAILPEPCKIILADGWGNERKI